MRKLIVCLLAAWLVLTVFGQQAGAATAAWDWGDGVRYRHVQGPIGPHPEWRDTDKVVPVHRYCGWVNGKNAFTHIRTTRDGATGRIVRVEATMYINKCNFDFHNRSAEYRERSKRHELAHAAGWGHGEGNPRINAAYYP